MGDSHNLEVIDYCIKFQLIRKSVLSSISIIQFVRILHYIYREN
jgi:hypothetical protein